MALFPLFSLQIDMFYVIIVGYSTVYGEVYGVVGAVGVVVPPDNNLR